jgi:hypothetical protein
MFGRVRCKTLAVGFAAAEPACSGRGMGFSGSTRFHPSQTQQETGETPVLRWRRYVWARRVWLLWNRRRICRNEHGFDFVLLLGY